MDRARSQRETWLVLRAQAGDRGALDELLRGLQQPLYGYLASLVGSRPLAEDLLQETFLLIYRKLRWLREPELFRSWAFRIASREAFRRLRRERRFVAAELDEASFVAAPAESGDPATRELARRLPELVAGISPGSRAVIALHYLDEMPLGEVSAVLGIALGTVKSRLAYGLQQLRRALDTDDPDTRKETP
jgi:RNA polymerase sigma-70 factor (ECF subfamily)